MVCANGVFAPTGVSAFKSFKTSEDSLPTGGFGPKTSGNLDGEVLPLLMTIARIGRLELTGGGDQYDMGAVRYRDGNGSGCARIGLHQCRQAGGIRCVASKPEAVDGNGVLETLPHGTGIINVVYGGLQVLNAEGADGVLIANAIVIVSMDDGK